MGPVSGVRPYVRPLTFHKNVFSSKSAGPIHTIFGVRHQGNEALSGCAPYLDPPPLGGIRKFTPKFGLFFKNLLVRNYCAECTEIDMEASGAHLDVVLCMVIGPW